MLNSEVLTPFPGGAPVLRVSYPLAGHRAPSPQKGPATSPSAGSFVPTHFSLELSSRHPIYDPPPISPPEGLGTLSPLHNNLSEPLELGSHTTWGLSGRGEGEGPRVSRTVVLSPHLYSVPGRPGSSPREADSMGVIEAPGSDVLKSHPEGLMCRRAESPACVMVSWWASWELGP